MEFSGCRFKSHSDQLSISTSKSPSAMITIYSFLLRFSIFHLSILGIVVHDSCYTPVILWKLFIVYLFGYGFRICGVCLVVCFLTFGYFYFVIFEWYGILVLCLWKSSLFVTHSSLVFSLVFCRCFTVVWILF